METNGKKFHFAIYGVLLTPSQEILLVAKGKGPYMGTFDLPGGRPEHGESCEEVLIREMREETGIEITPSSPTLLFFDSHLVEYTAAQGQEISLHHMAAVYRIPFSQEMAKCPLLEKKFDDVLGASFIAWSQLKQMKLSPFAHKAVTFISNHLT